MLGMTDPRLSTQSARNIRESAPTPLPDGAPDGRYAAVARYNTPLAFQETFNRKDADYSDDENGFLSPLDAEDSQFRIVVPGVYEIRFSAQVIGEGSSVIGVRPSTDGGYARPAVGAEFGPDAEVTDLYVSTIAVVPEGGTDLLCSFGAVEGSEPSAFSTIELQVTRLF